MAALISDISGERDEADRRLHTTSPATIAQRRPTRSEGEPTAGRTASVVRLCTPNSHPSCGTVNPSTSREYRGRKALSVPFSMNCAACAPLVTSTRRSRPTSTMARVNSGHGLRDVCLTSEVSGHRDDQERDKDGN